MAKTVANGGGGGVGDPVAVGNGKMSENLGFGEQALDSVVCDPNGIQERQAERKRKQK